MAAASGCTALVQEQPSTPPPAFFCPISLELMTDPVTASSGITYERASIHEWLAAGHRTCPVTRQPLLPFQLVPNYTLLRIIDSWCLSHSPSSCTPSSSSSAQTIISSVCTDALIKLGLVDQGPATGPIILPPAQAPPLLISLLAAHATPSADPLSQSACQDALSSLCSLPLSSLHLCSLSDPDALQCLLRILHTSEPSSSHSAFLLANVISRHPSPQPFLRSLPLQTLTSIIDGLALNLKIHSPPADHAKCIFVSLSLLTKSCRSAGISEATCTAMAHVALNQLLHSSRQVSSDYRSQVSESAISLLEDLAAFAEGRAAIASHAFAVPTIAKLLHPSTTDVAVESAVVVLWKLCRAYGVQRLKRQAIEACVPGKVALVLQFCRTCSSRTKLKAGALLRLLLREDPTHKQGCINVAS